MKNFSLIHKSFLIFIAASIIGFCIITNSGGDYRSYLPADLPFVIQLNQDTPNSYDTVIQDALDTWNNVEGSYFEFQLGPRVSADDASSDGINLLYFDANNDNFDPGSNTIAFSRTFTSSVGGYHAVESDYIYNAAGYPPATDGSAGQMDLMTITLHEIGHHQGLSHHGPAGNDNGGGSAGCGENLPSQVMYWSVGLGSQKRQLFIHDEMGAVAIYPEFMINGMVTDADNDQPIENAKLVFNEGTYAAYVDEEVDNAANRSKRPGEVYTSAPTLEDGSYLLAMQHEDFSFRVEKFGYVSSDEIQVDFNTPSGFGNTQFQEYNFELTKTARVNLSGSITNTKTGEGAQPEIIVTWVQDETEFQTTVANEDGSYSFLVPSNAYYQVELFFNPPFEEYYAIDSVMVGSSDATLDINVTPSDLLFVYDGSNASLFPEYRNSLNNLGVSFVEWNIEHYLGSPNEELLDQFSDPLTVVWVAGGDTSSQLAAGDIPLLENHLSKGNRLIMAGRNIVEFEDSNGVLFSEYAGVRHVDNSSALRVNGFEGDIIGDGISTLMIGAGKDIFELSDSRKGTVDRVLYYGTSVSDTNNIAAVRSQNETEGWKFILFSDGLDKVNAETMDTLLSRSIKYAGNEDFVTGVEVNFNNDELPNIYSISQNYPNPFNPSTTIKFALPVNANVKLTVYNILGEQVDVIKDGMMNAGSYELRWNAVGSSLSSGIYFYHIDAEGVNGSIFNETKKMILLK